MVLCRIDCTRQISRRANLSNEELKFWRLAACPTVLPRRRRRRAASRPTGLAAVGPGELLPRLQSADGPPAQRGAMRAGGSG
jgi:hypothetical protein